MGHGTSSGRSGSTRTAQQKAASDYARNAGRSAEEDERISRRVTSASQNAARSKPTSRIAADAIDKINKSTKISQVYNVYTEVANNPRSTNTDWIKVGEARDKKLKELRSKRR